MNKNSTPWHAGMKTYFRLLGYTRRYWPAAIVAVLGMIIDPACMGLFAKSVKPMLDGLFILRDPFWIFWMPVVIIAIFLIRSAAIFSADYGSAYIGRGVVQNLRQEVFNHYLRLPSSFFDREPSGHQIARITYSSEQVAQATTEAVKVAVVDTLSVVFLVLNMALISAQLTLVLLLMVPLIGLLVTFVSMRYRRINQRIQRSMGTATGVIEEAVGGHREVKVFGAQRYESRRFNVVSEQTRRLSIKIASINGLASSSVQLIAAVCVALIVYLSTRPSILPTLTPGDFTSLMLSMGGILASLKRLTSVQANLQKGIAAAEEIFGLIDTATQRDDGTLCLSEFNSEIEFRDVHLTYTEGAKPALRGLSFRCSRGTVTALVGRSGSGKSTVANLLPRFYEPSSGSVLMDGHPLGDYTLASLRLQIAWVGQNTVLFDDTVARNIAYGDMSGVAEADIIAAADSANAMEFIRHLPQGIHTQIGQRGVLLSGGQRQRIAIARALLKDAPILILDEATSALDNETERLIQDALARLMKDRTVLVIAHRLSTVEHADQIVVLDQGLIVERGSHKMLLARNGHYAALHRMQFRDRNVDVA